MVPISLHPHLLPALSQVSCVDAGESLLDLGYVHKATLENGVAEVHLAYRHAAATSHASVRANIQQRLMQLPQVQRVKVHTCTQIQSHSALRSAMRLAGVRNIIAVASGKGGVGKSTTAVNLALALLAEGATVGVLDADIYGPSIPTMLGISGRPESDDGVMIAPKIGHGLQTSSIGYLMEQDEALIWRGPMVTQALEQLLRHTQWRDLDYLLIDLPPGTGDIHLTLSQTVPLTGAVVVTTPQEVALSDARKGLVMFKRVKVPVLGVIENMSLHICTNCRHVDDIFGSDGAQAMAQAFDVPMLGQLPLDKRIRQHADQGRPTLVSDPDGAISQLYLAMARQISLAVSRLSLDYSHRFPSIVVQAT